MAQGRPRPGRPRGPTALDGTRPDLSSTDADGVTSSPDADGVTSSSARHYLQFSATSPALGHTLDLAASALDRPVAVLHILDEAEQYVLAESGAPGLAGTTIDARRATCLEVMRTGEPLCIPDARVEQRIPVEPMLENGMVSYLGYPLFGREMQPIGTLCVVDVVPRDRTDRDVEVLGKFAAVVEEQLELQRQRLNAPAPEGEIRQGVVDGLQDGSIRPWFQPIIDLVTGATVGVEALARWHHPQRGVLLPGVFLPPITDTDIVLDLDRAIITDAARVLASTDDVVLHCNISVRHLLSTTTADALIAAIRDCALPPKRLVLEVTESDAAHQTIPATATLDVLRQMGVRIFLDDLGTGWSTLTRLLTWPVDGVKIDWSIASSLGTATGDSLISGIVNHARARDIPVVIEGIETPGQAAIATGLGCSHAQGYLWARPTERPTPAPVIPGARA